MKISSSTNWKTGDKGKTSQGEIEKIDNDIEYVKCPVCKGNPRRWLSYEECMSNCIHPGSYEDCTNCEDGYVPLLINHLTAPGADKSGERKV